MFNLQKLATRVNAMSNQITVRVKNVYGRDMVYPVCQAAKLLCDLCNAKTFNTVQINIIKDLGYDILIGGQTLPNV